MTPRGFSLSRAWLFVAIIISILLAGACFLWAASVEGTWSTVASALAATFLSIAMVTLITEVLLKPIFVEDIVRFVELRERLKDVGILDVSVEGDVPWKDLFGKSKAIRIVIIRPQYWQSSHLPLLITRAKTEKTQIDLYFPSPDNDTASIVARNLGIDPKSYIAEILGTKDDIETAWMQARPEKSSLRIEYLNDPPQHGLASFDDRVIVTVPPVVPNRTSEYLVSQFDVRDSREAREWSKNRWSLIVASKHPTPAYAAGVNTTPISSTSQEDA